MGGIFSRAAVFSPNLTRARPFLLSSVTPSDTAPILRSGIEPPTVPASETVASLFTQHRTQLYGFLFAALLNHHDAEDVLQEVAAAAIRSADRFTPGTCFSAWIREIARRRVLEFVRRRPGQRFPLAEPEVIAQLADAAARADVAEPCTLRGEALRHCYGKLNGVARQVMDLKYREHLSADEIAARLRRTASAAYSILKRSREALRHCVEKRLTELRAAMFSTNSEAAS